MPWGPKPRSVSVGVRLGGAGAHKKIETGAPVGVRAHSSPQPSAMARRPSRPSGAEPARTKARTIRSAENDVAAAAAQPAPGAPEASNTRKMKQSCTWYPSLVPELPPGSRQRSPKAIERLSEAVITAA